MSPAGAQTVAQGLRTTQISSAGQRLAHSSDTNQGYEVVGVARRLQLDEVIDDEAVTAEQADPLAVGEHEVDRFAVGDPLHAEAVRCNVVVTVQSSSRHMTRSAVELQKTRRPCRAEALVRPRARCGPDRRRSSPRDRRRRRRTMRSRTARPPRSPAGTAPVRPCSPRARAARLTDRARYDSHAEPRERDRPLPTTTAELEHIEPGEVTQRTDL